MKFLLCKIYSYQALCNDDIKITQLSKVPLLSFILLCHLFSTFSFANSITHTSFINYQNKELTAICSGNGSVKWINLTDFYTTGKITFVEPTSNTSNSLINSCESCVCYNLLDNIDVGLIVSAINNNNLPTSASINFISFNTKQTLLVGHPRGPPLFS